MARGGAAAVPLWLASVVYRMGFALVKAVRRPSVRLGIPVISVGNITVGGAGKTPLVGWLAEELAHRGYRVGIVARGYKRDSDEPLLARGDEIQKMDVEATGDEVKLLAQMLPDVMFSIHKTKARAARVLAASSAADVIVVDDGFQHWALHRDVDIVALDASMDPKLALPFPRGMLREGFRALGRADLIIITRANLGRHVEWVRDQISRAPGEAEAFEARFVANDIHADFVNRLPITYLRSRSVFLFAGIGHFGGLAEQVKRLAGKVAGTMELEDHQSFSAALLERIRAAAERQKADLLLTTAKDWVKLGDFDFGRETYYLGLTVKIDKDRELLEIIEQKLTLKRQAGAHG